jgi:hypothetical protein
MLARPAIDSFLLPAYTEQELTVMQAMAHGGSRFSVAEDLGVSAATLSRVSRSAAIKAGATPNPNGGVYIISGICIMVAQGVITVRQNNEKDTPVKSAEDHYLTKLLSCLDWQEFEELRASYADFRKRYVL